RQIRIKKDHYFYPYCADICQASARLYNRGTYLVRQYATAVDRLEAKKELTPNQKEAYEQIREITWGTKYFPESRWLNYGQLDFFLKCTGDAAYRGMPSQANQQTLRCITRNFKSFFKAVKEHSKRPERFTGRPKMPGYKKKGSMTTAVLTNQICKVQEEKNIKYLRFPGTDLRINVDKYAAEAWLKEVRIKPHADSFVIDIVLQFEDPDVTWENPLLEMDGKKLRKHLEGIERNRYRVASIDPGTNNLCAITNNFGAQPFLIKGGVVKSENRYYNKQLAKYRSEAKKCNDAYYTKKIDRLHDRRNRIIKDQMHKISRAVTDWAVENEVDLVVMGHNIFQKQKINMTHVNNQNFVQIPFKVLADMLRYKLNEKGIAFLETEEAYTSQADYLAKDPIPKYKKGKKAPKMSGTRSRRGVYRHKDGTVSNADINGAANIMRKVFPNVTEWNRGLVDRPYAVKIA
ncbi:MAG: RNA-guided endonuclease TnpB family protein, partial [Lachnospiraceae bacterium]|nr:RNA-guided endonuclease TnpB family protein [Lachnospiraceae bacterium]